MIDSSKWEVIEAGLKCIQGKGVVNSISMKEGEAEFLRQAKLARRYGAAVVVMAFDERAGRHLCAQDRNLRARLQLLTETVGFPAEDIIFDPNIFAIATGIEEHNNYAVDFIEAWSAGSRAPAGCADPAACRMSPSRSAATIRCAKRSTRSSCTTRSGRPVMGIVNAGQLGVYDEHPDRCATRSRTWC
jgi:5-methyltetrahydrofolate--homocysteine methyltransferase